MKKLILFFIIFQAYSCSFQNIYKDYDEFTNVRKFKLSDYYYAKRDFFGNKKVEIEYYKSINKKGETNISAKFLLSSNFDDGPLSKNLDIRIDNKSYRIDLYDYQTNNVLSIAKNSNDEQDSSDVFFYKENMSTRNLAYFNISNSLADKIVKSNSLIIRFYLGKEACTIKMSKSDLKRLRKFLLLQ